MPVKDTNTELKENLHRFGHVCIHVLIWKAAKEDTYVHRKVVSRRKFGGTDCRLGHLAWQQRYRQIGLN